MAERVAIVGVGQTRHRSRRPDVNQSEMINEAVTAALNDAHLSIKDIDCVVQGDMELFQGNYLGEMWTIDGSGAYGKPGMRITTGGTTGSAVACTAYYYTASGLFDTVLAVGWQKHDEGDPNAGLTTVSPPLPPMARYLSGGAMAAFAAWGAWYMREYGAKPEHAAMVRLKADKNACRNPNAQLRLGLKSIEDVLNSRILVWPLRLLDMCPASCGAAAMVIASEKKAKKITKKPVWVKDWVTAHQESMSGGGGMLEMRAVETSHTNCARKLYKRNGITNPWKQIDVFEMYEPSTWGEMIWMEDFLLCERGQAYKLVEKGATELEGEFPLNPSGGVVTCNPIGATAMLRPLEAALQIRGDAGEHQVPKDVKLAVGTGFGGSNWTVMTLLSKTMD